MARAPRIAIRADASVRIGTGHVRRMRSLASALGAAGAEPRFFGRPLGLDGARLAGGHPWTDLAAPSSSFAPPPGSPPHAAWAEVDQLDDAAEFAAAAAAFRPDWVIVDHYAFDASWHDAVRGALGCRVAVIDDVADRPLAPDLIVDHNLHPDHRAKYAGLLRRSSDLLVGPRHAMLDPVFAAAARHRPHDRAERIGLFLGGADPADMTGAMLAELRAQGFDGVVGVATSSANPNIAGLRERAAADGRATLFVDLPDLAGFFADHDVQIGAGGGATWERLCVGAPSVLVALADNQHDVLRPLEAHGVATVLPPVWCPEDACAAALALAGDAAERRAMSARAQAMVDGRGASRIAEALSGRTGQGS